MKPTQNPVEYLNNIDSMRLQTLMQEQQQSCQSRDGGPKQPESKDNKTASNVN